jgi:hypothetical protein
MGGTAPLVFGRVPVLERLEKTGDVSVGIYCLVDENCDSTTCACWSVSALKMEAESACETLVHTPVYAALQPTRRPSSYWAAVRTWNTAFLRPKQDVVNRSFICWVNICHIKRSYFVVTSLRLFIACANGVCAFRRALPRCPSVRFRTCPSVAVAVGGLNMLIAYEIFCRKL